MIGAGDVARAPGAGSHARSRLDHRANHLWVLPHAQIIIRAPDHDLARSAQRMPDRVRKPPDLAFQVGKYTIATLVSKPVQCGIEKSVIVQAGRNQTRRAVQAQNFYVHDDHPLFFTPHSTRIGAVISILSFVVTAIRRVRFHLPASETNNCARQVSVAIRSAVAAVRTILLSGLDNETDRPSTASIFSCGSSSCTTTSTGPDLPGDKMTLAITRGS